MTRTRLAVALDLDDDDAAVGWARTLRGHADVLKIGLQLFTAHGPDIVRRIQDLGWPVFLDLKIHDIPATAARAVAVATALEVELLTVHATGGPAMLGAAAAARGAASMPKLLGVTLLTSLGPNDLGQLGWSESPEQIVSRLCSLSRDHGCDGVVASVGEAAAIKRSYGSGFLVVTPGIRPVGAAEDDQSRVATPAAAALAGADYIVVGRPILQAGDAIAAADAIIQELATASGKRIERVGESDAS